RGERRRSDSKRSPPAGGGDRRNVAQRSGGAGQAGVPPSPFPSFFPSSFSGRPGASSGPAAFGSSERACSSRSSRIAVDQGSEPASESAGGWANGPCDEGPAESAGRPPFSSAAPSVLPS